MEKKHADKIGVNLKDLINNIKKTRFVSSKIKSLEDHNKGPRVQSINESADFGIYLTFYRVENHPAWTFYV